MTTDLASWLLWCMGHLCLLLSLVGRQRERSRSKVMVMDTDTCLPPRAAGSLKERPRRCFTMASPCSGEWVAMATRSRISWLDDCNLCVGGCVMCEGVCRWGVCRWGVCRWGVEER